MRKILCLLLSVSMILASFSACSTDSDTSTSNGELNLFTWEGMFPQEVLDAFEEETGITINYSTFDTDETMLAKLQASNGGDYDLVIADDYIIETAIAEGLVQELDSSKLENYENINPIYQSQFYDPDNSYTVPHGAGVMTIVYDPSAIDIEITGYEDLWDTSLVDNVGIVESYRVINGVTLLTMGESMNTEDVDLISQAGEKLLELAPNIRVIKNDNLQDDLLSGEVSVALMYASQTTTALLTNPELEVVYPEEGLGFGIMAQFIPVNAPNSDAAYAFIDFILDAEVGKACFEYLGYYSTNQAADELIADEYKSFLTLPEDVEADEMEIIQNISTEADAQHSLVWTEFKSATN